MMVVESRLGLRKAFIMHDTELALKVAQERKEYARIQVISLSPLELPDFRMKKRSTGVIKLGSSMEEIVASFNATTRKHIHRTERDPGFRFEFNPSVTDIGYALVVKFVLARGLKPHPRSYYQGCVEFLGFTDNEPVSGIFLFPAAPVGLIAAVFSKRHEDCTHDEYLRVGNTSKRLMAEVCAWGANHGMTDMDMGGLNLDANEKSGIAKYKLGFNPIVTEQYVYTYDSPLFRVSERIMFQLRKFQRKFRSKL